MRRPTDGRPTVGAAGFAGGWYEIEAESARADDIRPYSTPASQSLPDRANEFQSVFPATCAAEKLPEAKRHASPRADQLSEAKAMERESFQGEPHRGSPWTLKKAGLFCKARQDRVSASDDAKG